MEVWTLWTPTYWLSGAIKGVTAVASLSTAVGIFYLLPHVFRLIQTAKASEERRRELARTNQELERAYQDLARSYPSQVAVHIGFDEALSHRIEAGCDFFLMPSRFEPCGLNQMYGLRYGTIPIVHGVGGLDDTVVDFDPKTRTGSGFKFDECSGPALLAAIKRAISAYHTGDAWREMVLRAMRLDYSWGISARRHLELYEGLLHEIRPS